MQLDEAADTDWIDLDPPALAAHIVDIHHRYLHEELPLLDALAAKVLDVHGLRHPELREVRRLVAELRADLEPHLMKEERILFPAIAVVADGHNDFPFRSIANLIRMMTLEHDRDGELLRQLRAVTNVYTAPADGCASYRSLYERLEALEADTHQHILQGEPHVVPRRAPARGRVMGIPSLPTRRRPIATVTDVELLVRRFYQAVIPDPLLGPIFEGMPVDWATHIPKLVDFWAGRLLDIAGYEGNPVGAHQPVLDRFAFGERELERWLELWDETVDELFVGEVAELAKARARMAAGAIGALAPPPAQAHAGCRRGAQIG